MKKLMKALCAAIVLLMSAGAFAKDFDWSQCWCNYGAGLENGDFIVSVDGGVNFYDLTAFAHSMNNPWYMPPVMVDINYVQPIWRLPFTFGAFAGVNGYGATYKKYYVNTNETKEEPFYCWNIFFGGECAYHVMLPPEKLDVYASIKLIGNIPIYNDANHVTPVYFYFGEAVGAYWFFTENFGANLEFGWPFSKIGFSFKF